MPGKQIVLLLSFLLISFSVTSVIIAYDYGFVVADIECPTTL
jgi:hypothetical protein